MTLYICPPTTRMVVDPVGSYTVSAYFGTAVKGRELHYELETRFDEYLNSIGSGRGIFSSTAYFAPPRLFSPCLSVAAAINLPISSLRTASYCPSSSSSPFIRSAP